MQRMMLPEKTISFGYKYTCKKTSDVSSTCKAKYTRTGGKAPHIHNTAIIRSPVVSFTLRKKSLVLNG
jgi:hypothetical protein